MLDEGEGFEVLTADRLLGDVGISEGHVVVTVTQQFHEGRQAHTGREQCRGIGVSKAVCDHFPVCFESDAGFFKCLRPASIFHLLAEVGLDKEASTRSIRMAVSELVDERGSSIIQRDESFGIELAEGDIEKVVAEMVVSHAVEFQGGEFADAESCFSHEEKRLSVDVVGICEAFLKYFVSCGS